MTVNQSVRRLCAGGVLAALALSGCHSSAVQRQFSPLIGSWTLNGSAPAPDPNMPKFTALTFHRNGNLDATYVAAGGALAGVVHTNPKTGSENDTYSIVSRHHLRIVEGSRSLDYTYHVRDGKLFLRSASGDDDGTSTVFRKVNSSDAAGTDSGADGTSSDSSSDSNGSSDTSNN